MTMARYYDYPYFDLIKENIPELDIGLNAWSLVLNHVSDGYQYFKFYLDVLEREEHAQALHIDMVFTKSLHILINDFYDSLDEELNEEISKFFVERFKTGKVDTKNLMSALDDITSNSINFAYSEIGENIYNPNAFKYMVSDMIILLLGLLCYKNNVLLSIGAAAFHVFSRNYNELLYVRNIDFNKLLERKISEQNKRKAKNRWSKHNEIRSVKKQKYLRIMREKGFTTFSETADYIKLKFENKESTEYKNTKKKPLSHATIERWLSQANKGDFS